jgi:tetratricopeptide (TPR) repeat protein
MRALEATSLYWLGQIAMFTRNAEGSKDYLNRALEILGEIGDRRGQGSVLLGLCSAHRRLEEFYQCQVYGEQALALARETGERREEGWALVELGKARRTSGDYAGAAAYWEPALPIFEETGSRRGEAWVREMFGWLARVTGENAAARDYMEQALPLFRQVRELRSEGRVLVELAEYCLSLGDHDAGLTYAREASSLGERIGNAQIQGTALTVEGYILYDVGQFAPAAAAFQQAISLRQGFIIPITVTLPLAGLVKVCLAQGDRARALSHVEAILESAGTPSRLRHLTEPFPVFLVVYRVLHANGDRRAAEVLETAHRLLLAQAAKIGSEDLRRAYLENVAAHREVVALWERDSGPSSHTKREGLRIA